MTTRLIDYDAMVQQALLDVVRKLLTETAKHGLPGEHHFYIAFRTGYPGVTLPKHLKEKYPEEMTIVLQNQYWDLKVTEDHFEIGLSFNQRPETLSIPFAAISGFLDPSVEFGLQFQHQVDTAGLDEAGNKPPSEDTLEGETAPPDEKPSAESDEKSGESSEKVVTLDAFRKKK